MLGDIKFSELNLALTKYYAKGFIILFDLKCFNGQEQMYEFC